MTSLKWTFLFFALFTLTLTGWIQHIRGEEPIIPWLYFSSQQSGDDELYRMHPDGTAQQRLSFSEGREHYVFIGEEWIYFSKGHTFYRMRPNGSGQEPILTDYGWCETFSPDGQWIYFMAERDGERGLYRMRSDGTQQTRLTPLENEVWFQSFDANNEWLYYTLQEDSLDNKWALYRMYLDGSQSHKLVDLAGYDEFHGFSPDNQWLYFTAGRNRGTIYRMNLTDFSQEQLTPDGAYDTILYSREYNNRLRFSADKTWLYVSTSTGDANFDVYRMHLDGSAREQLTNFPANEWLRQLAPNGERVYFTMDVDDIQQIFSMRPDGSDLHQASDSKSDAWSRAFSPDGQWLFYSDDEDFYRVRLDGSQHQNLTSEKGKDIFWAFSQDGQWVYFDSWRTGYRHIYRMHLDGTNVEQLTPNFNGNNYWGGFGTPVDLIWHSMRLQAIAGGLLVGWIFISLGRRVHNH